MKMLPCSIQDWFLVDGFMYKSTYSEFFVINSESLSTKLPEFHV
jgi:hypothetical protein